MPSFEARAMKDPAPLDAALTEAAAQDNLVACQMALEQGGDVNAIDRVHWSALHWAAANGNVEICELLRQHDADSDIEDEEGWTPLEVAAWEGRFETFDYLLRVRAETTGLPCPNRSEFVRFIVREEREVSCLLLRSEGVDIEGVAGLRPGAPDTPFGRCLRLGRLHAAVEIDRVDRLRNVMRSLQIDVDSEEGVDQIRDALSHGERRKKPTAVAFLRAWLARRMVARLDPSGVSIAPL